jgi:cytochrome P450
MISNVYSKTHIQNSQASFEQARTILLDRLLPIIKESTSAANKPHGLDVHSLFLATTMDFISSYVFGIASGTNFLQQASYREHWLELYKSRNDYGFYDQELPTLTKIARRLGIPLCPWHVDYANAELGQWCEDLCTSTIASIPTQTKPGGAVVMSALLSGLEKEYTTNGTSSSLYPTALSQHSLSVASELFDHVLAGQETAGVTLTCLTWRLSQSLSLQAQLREELLTLVPNMKYPSTSLPDPKQLDVLPVLHAIMMETLRLHAPIPGPQPRQTPFPSCRLGGYTVPGGVRVAAMAYTLHRSERVFPEPEKWDHTRWLPAHATEEERRERQRAFWAFGSGGRMCIGSNFAGHGEFSPLVVVLVDWRE